MIFYHGTTEKIKTLRKGHFLSSSENIAYEHAREGCSERLVYIFWYNPAEIDMAYPGKNIVPAWVSRVDKAPIGILRFINHDFAIEKADSIFKQPTMYLLQFFEYKHLPPHLQKVSKPFCDLAHEMADELESNPETTTAIRKLLEAKDCAVRSLIFKS